VFAYKISGFQPGFSEGLVFNSCVPDLQFHPELWLDECPYLQPRLSSRVLEGLRVELVSADDEAFRSRVRAPATPYPSMALAA